MGITNKMYDHYKPKCMGTTNEMYGHYKSKCMVIISEMYSHYKPSYIQFLTLGGLHDRLYKPSKFPFLVGHMTCLHKHKSPLQFSLFVGHMT